jgi:hypothetical protein
MLKKETKDKYKYSKFKKLGLENAYLFFEVTIRTTLLTLLPKFTNP